MTRFRFSRLFRPFNRLAGDQSGVSAVEFALILPLMLTLYIGGHEFGQALTINRKVTQVTSTIADLVTQSKTITNADMVNFFDASEGIMLPYDSGNLTMTVSLLSVDASGIAKVVWTDSRDTVGLTVNSVVNIPDTVDAPSTYLIRSEVHYQYTPRIGYQLTGTFDLTDTFYLRPRLGTSIARIAS